MSIAAIHTIKSKLRLSESNYRALLMRVAGVRSSTELSPGQDKLVMAELRDLERLINPPAAAAPKTPQERKIWALWLGSDASPGLCRYLPEEKRCSRYLAGIVGRFGTVRWDGASLRFDRMTITEAKKAIDALSERLRCEEQKMADVPF
ncbi:MAG: DUF1018 domain-containing protein [Candidatus Pacebacteria bacterium]|nr:DUF1018 domain-containing protein [Candidatus Paceibacterota bacterium]